MKARDESSAERAIPICDRKFQPAKGPVSEARGPIMVETITFSWKEVRLREEVHGELSIRGMFLPQVAEH